MFRQILREVHCRAMGFDEPPFENVLDSLKTVQSNLEKQKSPVEWDFVRLHLGMMKISKKNSDFFYDVFGYVLCLFDVYHCRNFSILADTFQLECFILEFSTKSFQNAKTMRGIMLQNQTCCERNGLNFVAKLMKMPYQSLNSPFNIMYDAIQMHVVSVEDRLLKYLLRYGIMYVPLNDHRTTWSHCWELMNGLLGDSEKHLLLNSRSIQSKIKDLSPESRRRMLVVFRGIEVILNVRGSPLFAYELARSLRMAFETIPEPFITSQEVENFLTTVLSGSSVSTIIAEMRKDYEKWFRESCEPLAPRPLKHLSRCQVKQNLRQAGNFPWGLMDIELPAAIKDYIWSVESDYLWPVIR